MRKYEFSKLDFELLNEVINDYLITSILTPALEQRLETMKQRLEKAHTGWLEIEED
jgi:hypothetical protein